MKTFLVVLGLVSAMSLAACATAPVTAPVPKPGPYHHTG